MFFVVYLIFDEIEKFEFVVLVGCLDWVRDCFFFMMYIGMCWSDYRIFYKDMIKGDIIEYCQVKINNFVMFFIFFKICKFLEKYDYDLLKYSNQKFNIYLKEFFFFLEMNRMVEVEYNVFKKFLECISCYIVRKIFIMVSFEKGIGV